MKKYLLTGVLISLFIFAGCAGETTSVRKIKKTLGYRIISRETTSLPDGESVVKQKGRRGEKLVFYKITSLGGRVKSRKFMKSRLIRPARARIVLIGTQKQEEVEEDIPFTTSNIYDASLAKGKSWVKQNGKAGKKIKLFTVGYLKNLEVSRTSLSETITISPITKIVVIGTKTGPTEAEIRARARAELDRRIQRIKDENDRRLQEARDRAGQYQAQP
ncbi:MAG TPA: hypothetical protein ENI11_06425 [Actinobacteria bacterium]|nr:hypothetical protein [Actinomycetota bacterium]